MPVAVDFSTGLVHWPLLVEAVAATAAITVLSASLGVALGVGCAWARQEGQPWLRRLACCYAEIVRDTPFLLQLACLYVGLPGLGVTLSPLQTSVLAMLINLGAHTAEIVRAGIADTPRGQIEAGLSLALNRWQLFTRIVLPPAFQKAWPALVSRIVIVMLGTVVCDRISTEDLFFAADLIQWRDVRAVESLAAAVLLYLLLAVLLRAMLNWIGERWLFGRRLAP